MRRWLIALATALVAGALWVGAAYADSTPYHGGYNDPATNSGAVTSRCAGCHRTHTAVGSELLKASTSYELCTSCHGPTGGLDAVDGVEWQTNSSHQIIPNTPPVGGNKGGGFVNAFMNTTLTAAGNPTALEPVSSAHKVNGMPGYTGGIAYGIGAVGSGAGSAVLLECTTCHDPHGGSGGTTTSTDSTGKTIITRTPTYRILRANVAAEVPGAAASVIVPEDSDAEHAYLVSSHWPDPATTPPAGTILNTYYGQSYANTSMTKLDDWCATCHTRIHTSAAGLQVNGPSASTPTNDPIYKFRHNTAGTSTENNLGTATLWPSGSPGCVTCHVSHGSSAAWSGRSAQILKPGVAPVTTGTQPTADYLDSSLLRLDNHGVCEVCHNK